MAKKSELENTDIKEEKIKDDNKKTNSKENKSSRKKLKIKVRKKSNSKKKKGHIFGPVEFSFNFLSLLIAISVALYFGGRSFYYYSVQNQAKKEVGITLNGQVLEDNKLVKEGDGLHKDDKGYFFKGKVDKNYVWFANRLFRVMRINDDGSVKLVSDDFVSSFMWGPSNDYMSSNVRTWLTKTSKEGLSGFYYETIPNIDRFVKKTKYTLDVLTDTKIIPGDVEVEDYIMSLSLDDYVTAGGKSSYLNNGKLFFLLGYNEDLENLYVEEDGSIVSCAYYDGYGIRATFTMNKNIPITQGDGTKKNPYVIDQGQDTNHVDSYVKLGNDVWKVFDERNGKLKMYLNGYIMADGAEVVRNYSLGDTRLNYGDQNNIGSYLLNYYNNLSYKNHLVDNYYPFGVLNDEIGYTLGNAYTSTYNGPIGLLNIFDYVSNNELSDFFRANVGNDKSTTQYSVLSSGLLEEADVTDSKHIVPVVSIEASSIKSGSGRIDNPYVVE